MKQHFTLLFSSALFCWMHLQGNVICAAVDDSLKVRKNSIFVEVSKPIEPVFSIYEAPLFTIDETDLKHYSVNLAFGIGYIRRIRPSWLLRTRFQTALIESRFLNESTNIDEDGGITHNYFLHIYTRQQFSFYTGLSRSIQPTEKLEIQIGCDASYTRFANERLSIERDRIDSGEVSSWRFNEDFIELSAHGTFSLAPFVNFQYNVSPRLSISTEFQFGFFYSLINANQYSRSKQIHEIYLPDGENIVLPGYNSIMNIRLRKNAFGTSNFLPSLRITYHL